MLAPGVIPGPVRVLVADDVLGNRLELRAMRNRVKLVAVEQKGEGRHLLTTEHTMEMEDEPKPALVAVALVLAVVS